MEEKRYVHSTLQETTMKRKQLLQVSVPEFVGVDGDSIIRNSHFCLSLKEHPDCVFLRCRACKGCLRIQLILRFTSSVSWTSSVVLGNVFIVTKFSTRRSELKSTTVPSAFWYHLCGVKSCWVSGASSVWARRPNLTTPGSIALATPTFNAKRPPERTLES